MTHKEKKMANSDNCIVSVAFREPYVTHSKRQEGLIKATEDITHVSFINELPTRNGIITQDIISCFQKSVYGFKPHAIQYAIEWDNKKIIWLDPSVLPITPMKVLFDSLDEHPVIVRTGDAPLSRMCNEKSKNWFGVTDAQLEGIKHIGGTIYGFNFNNQKTIEVFNLWKKSEEEGIFGAQHDFMAGHWADEACMALALFKIGIDQYWEEKFRYLNQKEL